MGWQVWGDDFTSADFTGVSKFQTFRPNKNIILKNVRTWFIFINDPIFTDINLKIYSNEVRSGDNTPVQLITTSLSKTKSELITLENGIKETGFEFPDSIPLNANTFYNIVINGTGYSPSDTSYICWMKAFPDPVYSTGLSSTFENLGIAPYQMYLISGDY